MLTFYRTLPPHSVRGRTAQNAHVTTKERVRSRLPQDSRTSQNRSLVRFRRQSWWAGLWSGSTKSCTVSLTLTLSRWRFRPPGVARGTSRPTSVGVPVTQVGAEVDAKRVTPLRLPAEPRPVPDDPDLPGPTRLTSNVSTPTPTSDTGSTRRTLYPTSGPRGPRRPSGN